MTYCLDTDTCIDLLRGTHPAAAARFVQLGPEDVAVPAMVCAELFYGARRSATPDRVQRAVERFLAPLDCLPFDVLAAEHYATIRRDLDAVGTPIGPNDLVIAATARARGLTLVTHNVREFSRVPGLLIDDWLA